MIDPAQPQPLPNRLRDCRIEVHNGDTWVTMQNPIWTLCEVAEAMSGPDGIVPDGATLERDGRRYRAVRRDLPPFDPSLLDELDD